LDLIFERFGFMDLIRHLSFELWDLPLAKV